MKPIEEIISEIYEAGKKDTTSLDYCLTWGAWRIGEHIAPLQAENEALREEVERLKEYEFMYKSVSK